MRAEFRLRYLIVCIVMMFSVLSVWAYADEGIEVDVSYVISDVEFDVYRIGEVSRSGYELSSEFAGYSVDMSEASAAQTFESYIKRDGIEPVDIAKTGSDNKARFSGLDTGLYLITGEDVTRDGVIYTALPALVALDGQQSSVVVSSKHESRVVEYNESTTTTGSSGGGGGSVSVKKISITAQKVWSGDKRENEVTVQLLKDGEVYAEATLNSGNNWRCTWEKLSYNADWSVVEKSVPTGYEVSVEKDGNAFIITNKVQTTTTESTTESATESTTEAVGELESEQEYVPENSENVSEKSTNTSVGEEQGESGGSADDSADGMREDKDVVPNDSDTYSQKRKKDSTATEIETADGKLPQTGQLWWPVGVCACGGVALIMLGVGLIRKREE